MSPSYEASSHVNNYAYSGKLLSPAVPEARKGRYSNAPPPPRPSVRPSVCPSVTFSFRTVTRKRIDMFSQKLCRYVHHVMGVCCIVFYFDGMFFEFFMNFVNIEKNYFNIFFLQNISCFLHVLCYFQHLKNLLAGDLGWPSCLVIIIIIQLHCVNWILRFVIIGCR